MNGGRQKSAQGPITTDPDIQSAPGIQPGGLTSRLAAGAQPNVLWICTDQQRFDTINALGNSLCRTPNVDALIADGVAFTQAYCQSPVCTPSRASFLTGRYPRTTRCRQNGQTIPDDERLVSRLFADAGYRCGLAGKLHLASCSDGKVEERIDDGYHDFSWSHHPQPDWPENAYSQWLAEQGTSWKELYAQGRNTPYVISGVPSPLHQTTWCANQAVRFIRENRDRPWFFSFNCFDPHHPFDPPPDYLARYDVDAMPLPKRRAGELDHKPKFQQLDAQWAHNSPGEFHTAAMTDRDRREVCAAYYAMCELIDDCVGTMLAALAETGQRENTIVVFMSDHGEMLGDHGIYFKGPHFYDEAIRVPLVFSYPPACAPHRVSGMVELIDVAPTLLELAGLPVPDRMQGRSLLPHLRGEQSAASGREQVYCEYYNAWTHRDAYGTMLRTPDAKIVVYHGQETGELYDLSADPDEFDNLWRAEHAQSLKAEMMRRCFDASVFAMDPMPPRRGPF